MRVLLDEEQVVEVSGIMGNLEESGTYSVFFEFSHGEVNEGVQFEYQGIAVEEAKKRAENIIRQALEKGFVDCSQEPWDIVE